MMMMRICVARCLTGNILAIMRDGGVVSKDHLYIKPQYDKCYCTVSCWLRIKKLHNMNDGIGEMRKPTRLCWLVLLSRLTPSSNITEHSPLIV